jgi:lipid-A-disaccharide synthase
VPVTYVGHPLAEVIPLQPDTAGARQRLGLTGPAGGGHPAGQPHERAQAERRRLPGGGALLRQRDAQLQFVTPMAGDRQMAFFQQIRQGGYEDLEIQVIRGQSHSAMEASDAVLVASGTASLEVALYKKPMVISYKVNWASYQIMRHMAYQPWIGLPNILARDFLVPELLQHQATPKRWPMPCGISWKTMRTSSACCGAADMHHACCAIPAASANAVARSSAPVAADLAAAVRYQV